MKPFIISLLFILASPVAYSAAIPADIRQLASVGTVTDQQVNLNTIVKGKAPGTPFRLRTIPIQRQLIGSMLKSGGSMLLKRSPYWVAATAAMGLFVDNSGIISHQSDIPFPRPSAIGTCSLEHPMGGKSIAQMTYQSCNDAWYDAWAPYIGSYDVLFSYDGSRYYWRTSQNTKNSQFYGWGGDVEYSHTPISDSDFMDQVMPYIAANPDIKAFENPDDPTDFSHLQQSSITYIPEAENSDDERWLGNVLGGTAQTNDPAGNGYVPADELARIQQLANQIQQAATDIGKVDAANDAATAGVTQQSQAEAKKAEEAAVADAIGAPPVLNDLLAPFDDKLDGIGDIPDTSVYTIPSISPLSFGGGQCYEIPYNFGNFGSGTFDKHCGPYYSFGLPLITWFLYLSTLIYIWFLIESRVGRRVV